MLLFHLFDDLIYSYVILIVWKCVRNWYVYILLNSSFDNDVESARNEHNYRLQNFQCEL